MCRNRSPGRETSVAREAFFLEFASLVQLDVLVAFVQFVCRFFFFVQV